MADGRGARSRGPLGGGGGCGGPEGRKTLGDLWRPGGRSGAGRRDTAVMRLCFLPAPAERLALRRTLLPWFPAASFILEKQETDGAESERGPRPERDL